MKKILISFLMMFALFTGYTQVRNVDANKINVRNLLYSNGFYLIYNGDSLGQFDYDNMEDPTLPLDGVNLRTLRRSILAALDTSYVIDGDTIIIPRPDSLYDEADSTWKFSGMHIKFINQRDTFWNTYDNKWVHNGEQINHFPPDTVFDSQSQVWFGIDDTVNIDPSIYNELDSLFIESEGVWKSNGDTLSFADILERDSLLMIYYIAIQINNDTLASVTDDFYMFRKDPNCTHCWQYKLKSEPSTAWELFFCIPVPYSEIGIQREFQNILKIDYAGYWDIVSQGARDSIYFVKDSVDLSEKVLIQRNDSIIWGTYKAGSIDSLFDVDRTEWLKNGDSIYTKRDSIFYDGEWVKNDTLHITLPDSSKWAIDTYGIHNKSGNVGIGGNSNSGYALDVQEGINVYATNITGIDVVSENGNAITAQSVNNVAFIATASNNIAINAIATDTISVNAISGSGIGLKGTSATNYAIYCNSGLGSFSNKLTINSMIYPIADGDSSEAIITDGAGNLSWGDPSHWALDTYGMYNKVQNIGINTFSSPNAALNIHGRLKLNIVNSTPPGQLEVYSEADSLMGGAFYSSDQYAVGAYSTNNFGVYGWSDTSVGLVGWSEDSTGVAGYSTNGWSGYFPKNETGKGLYTDELVVSTMTYPTTDGDSLDVISTDGAGQLEFRTLGTMSNFNFWYGTQAEWTANTPHDGIYPQDATTYWNIKD